MRRADVKVELEEAGYKDVPDEVLVDFVNYLNASNDDASTSRSSKRDRKAKRKKNSYKPKKKNVDRDSTPKDVVQNELPIEERLEQWENKAKSLDEILKACTEIQRRTRPSLYSRQIDGKDNLTCYPILDSRAIGRGFIRPPDISNPPRFRFPIYKRELYYPAPDFIRQQRIKERKGIFVPSTETRRDDLRWRIRERITYSHPDYYIRLPGH